MPVTNNALKLPVAPANSRFDASGAENTERFLQWTTLQIRCFDSKVKKALEGILTGDIKPDLKGCVASKGCAGCLCGGARP